MNTGHSILSACLLTIIHPIRTPHNVATDAEVDSILAEAERLGAAVTAARHREWGGYSGYFADPDGFRWEIAVNPGETGAFVLPSSGLTITQ